MSDVLYVYIRRIWFFGNAPESIEWFDGVKCDAWVTGRFNDSVSEAKQIPCLIATPEEEYDLVQWILKSEELKNPNMRAMAIRIDAKDFARLERSET